MQHKSLYILGRQPELGRAELESLFGMSSVAAIGEHAMIVTELASQQVFQRLGGSTRVARLVGEFPTTAWPELSRLLTRELPTLLGDMPAEGKLKIGLSVFGLSVQPRQLLATGLELKKACKKSGRTARIVPNTGAELSSAQVLHNHLTGPLGIELLIVRDGDKTLLAQTVAVQNIETYAARDRSRPKRDARVGMLPPKLAQIIINLAAGPIAPQKEKRILDPFCGTGVVLQEALLMGFGVYGSDLEPRMVDFTTQNLAWLADEHDNLAAPVLEVGDATNHQWRQPFAAIASETYLGRPLAHWPDDETLHEIISTCNTIIEKFLHNIGGQTQSGTRFCLAVPAWRAPNGTVRHLPLLDHLGKMGYNRVSFEHSGVSELLYYRPDQLVARELLVITRK